MSKVMLIEDDATMLNLLGMLLQFEGLDVVKLGNENTLQAIVDSMRHHQPDLAVVDVHIRQVNGFDVVRAVRKDTNLSQMRILMSSGMNSSIECMEAGCDDFILKPFMPDDLIKRIRNLLKK
jgi:DNA-binding response OmpR family regulator